MLNQIIAFSLRNKMFVVAAALLLSVYGAYVSLHMSIDVLPDLNRPTVTIMAEAHAMVPQDVEQLVVRPIEQAINGATGITRVRSQSGLGLGVIYAEFDWNTEIFRNRQIVQEKLQLAVAKLPPGVDVQLAPVSSIMGQVQLIGIQSKSGQTDVSTIRALVDANIKPRLMSIAGVAQVISTGGAPRQLQISVDADKLRIYNVTMAEVSEAIQNANINSSGGFLNVGAKGPVITVTGRIIDGTQISKAVVRSDGVRPVRVDDIATVDFGPATLLIGNAGINGKSGVAIVISKQPSVDTVDLTNRVNKELADIQRGLPEDIVVINDVFQQALFIHRAVDNVIDAVRDGAVLVVVILVIFLMNFRTTVITLTAIPLSIAITAVIFAAFGLSINTMTLGGLAVAIGALVDDAIVDVENVYRRLRENSVSSKPRHPLYVIFNASSEVRKPILTGTLLVVVVYLPLFYMTGLEGKLFAPIGIAYIVSILASLVVSLTLTPALCVYLLANSTTQEHAKDGFVVRKLKVVSEKLIRFSVAHTTLILGVLGGTVLIGLLILSTRGSEFLPAFNEGTAQVNLNMPPEVGIKTSDEFGKRLEQVLVSVKGVKNVGRRTGRAEGDEHAMGVNVTEAIVTFDPTAGRSREEIVGEIRDRLGREFPGVPSETEQPLAHLLSHLLSGVNAQVAIKIYGPDLEVLRKTSAEIEAAIKPIPGVKDLYTQPLVMIDQVVAEPNREELSKYGLSVKTVAETFELGGGAEEVSRINVGQVSYPVIVRLEDKDRRDVNSLQNLAIRTPNGTTVRAMDVADVKISKTPNMIMREDISRRAVVQHNVGGRSLSEVVSDVEKALEPIRQKLAATPGYSIRVSGQFEAQAAATRLIAMLSLVALSAMFLILYMHFNSANLSIQILLSIPMAFVGAVAYITISKQTMSVATLVGLISLGGIAARNAILLIDHYLHLMREEKLPFSIDMIVKGGQERMVPVLMTALCAGIGLIPLALSPDEPGREILYPVATVIIGGLMSSTLLNFLVTPGVFWMFGRRDAERYAAQPHRIDPAADAISEEFEKPHTNGATQLDLHGKELSHG